MCCCGMCENPQNNENNKNNENNENNENILQNKIMNKGKLVTMFNRIKLTITIKRKTNEKEQTGA